MTTVAWDGKSVAVDTRITTEGHIIPGEGVEKCFRLSDGRVFAASGAYEDILRTYHWVKGGMRKSSRPEVSEVCALIASPDGAHCMEESLILRPLTGSKFYAFGTGGKYALMAMRLGKNAQEAVALASEFDMHTSADIVVMIPERKEKKKK